MPATPATLSSLPVPGPSAATCHDSSNQEHRPLRRYAVMSVSDKTGLLPLAQALMQQEIVILASTGTYDYLSSHQDLAQAGPYLMRIADYTGCNEILSSRVKTLHPKIHGGILADRNQQNHDLDLQSIGAGCIDYVIVNFYPFVKQRQAWLASLKTAAAADDPDTLEQSMLALAESIDIGGPCMLRAAAKNWQHVVACCHHEQYQEIIQHLSSSQPMDLPTRRQLAAAAFELTAALDQQIALTLRDSHVNQEEPPRSQANILPAPLAQLNSTSGQALLYGENSHQQATWHPESPAGWLGDIRSLHGPQLSYNNYLDLHACLKLLLEFAPKACAVVVKHGNPCGLACALAAAEPGSTTEILRRSLSCDTRSAFGGVTACSFAINEQHAELLTAQFYEVIMAPEFSEQSLNILRQKPRLRIILSPWLKHVSLPDYGMPSAQTQPATSPPAASGCPQEARSILGGMLVQERDPTEVIDPNTQLIQGAELMHPQALDDKYRRDATIAFQLVKHLKSNAICLVNDGDLIAQGSGFTSRIEAAEFALSKARNLHPSRLTGATLASDGFFPFRDVIDSAAQYGISCVISPSGSKRDHESVQAAHEHGIRLIFAPARHFLH